MLEWYPHHRDWHQDLSASQVMKRGGLLGCGDAHFSTNNVNNKGGVNLHSAHP